MSARYRPLALSLESPLRTAAAMTRSGSDSVRGFASERPASHRSRKPSSEKVALEGHESPEHLLVEIKIVGRFPGVERVNEVLVEPWVLAEVRGAGSSPGPFEVVEPAVGRVRVTPPDQSAEDVDEQIARGQRCHVSCRFLRFSGLELSAREPKAIDGGTRGSEHNANCVHVSLPQLLKLGSRATLAIAADQCPLKPP